MAAEARGSFGDLTPLLAPRSIAVVGASDREGNLGGLAVAFLQKFGFQGQVWPVNAGRPNVAGLACYPSLAALPAVPDLAILAVPAESVTAVVTECGSLGIPAAIAWAGGFAEVGEKGAALQRALEAECRRTGIKLCGPNCIGIINTSIGLTASFSSLMTELDHFTPGRVSIVSQSGGIAVTTHARAQALGLGFRVTISCGNEAAIAIPEFMQALVADEGTRVIAVYAEGISDPTGFVAALAAARNAGKPVVVLKGGAGETSAKAALAHTGRLAGTDRTYDAIFREFAAIRVHSTEELLEVSLQLADLPPGRMPKGNRVVISTFGGGSGVIATDQCEREGLTVPQLSAETRARLAPLLSPIASSMNPVDLTPGAITNPKLRSQFPAVLETLGDAPEADFYMMFSSGFGGLAPEVAHAYEAQRSRSPKPMGLSWLQPPPGIAEGLNAKGCMVFTEHSHLIRTVGHIVRHGANLRHGIRHRPELARPIDWAGLTAGVGPVISEHVASRVLEAAGLSVSPGQVAASRTEAVAIARKVGLPVAMKAISPAITHRAAAGLVALDLASEEAVAGTYDKLAGRAHDLGLAIDGVWVQHMFNGRQELLVTAFRDDDFGVMVGIGMGGAMTEIIDDVAFARAPIDAEGAVDLIGCLRTLRRLPDLIAPQQRALAAQFLADFSACVATAPWVRFSFEVNPLKLSANAAMAVDGLIVLE